MALMTAAEARVYIRGMTGTGEDTNINTLIARADGAFAHYLGFMPHTAIGTIEDVSRTEYLDAPGGILLRLPVWPVVSVTSIQDDPTHKYDGSTYLLASGDYTLYGDFGVVELSPTGTWGEWSEGFRNLKVVYVAGWATIPADIKHACGVQVAHWYRNRDSIGKGSINQAGGSAQVEPLTLLPAVKEALAPYRTMSGGIG